MKNYFIILIILLVSCNIPTKKGGTVEEIITNELATEKRNDTIFLNFRFGMSEKEFNQHLNKLINDKKLYKDSFSNLLTYDLVCDQYTTLNCTFKPEYFEDKLYKLEVKTTSKDNSFNEYAITLKLWFVYTEKYGRPDVEEKNKPILLCNKSIWINGNRMIELKCGWNSSRISYEDLSIRNFKRDRKKINSKIKAKESLGDI